MEEQVLRLLRQSPRTLFSAKEIGKHLDRERYREDALWARPLLQAMLRNNLIATDKTGYYYCHREESGNS